MHRGSNNDHFSAKHNTSPFVVAGTIEGEKQKQKKRLSFKEPEIEPRQIVVHKPAIQNLKSSFVGKTKDSRLADVKSLDDLALEDQALQIVKYVGQAFVNPRKSPESRDRLSSTLPITELTRDSFVESKKKTEISTEFQSQFISVTKQKRAINQKISEKNSVSSTPPTTMRCPIIEIATEDADKTAGVEKLEAGSENIRDGEHMSSTSKLPEVEPSWPTAARHQIQLLNFRLEQQRQQTKTAMSQIQLFKDQLEAESSARYQAQTQNQQLMNQNKELVNQIQQLFQQIQDLEKQIETYKKYSEATVQSQESKQASLAAPSTGYRRNSGSLWSTLSPSLVGRRNSATLSPTPLQNEPNQKFLTTDSFSRRTSITDDLATISSIAKFGGATDWRLRRRGSNNLNFDFPVKTKVSNGFNAIEDPSPPMDRTKIMPLFSSNSKGSMIAEASKSGIESRKELASTSKNVSLVIDEPSTSDYNSMPNLWSERSFRPIDPDGQRTPTKKQASKESTSEKQSLLTKSLETLRLFNS